MNTDELLTSIGRQIQVIQRQPGLGQLALGLAGHDWQLWQLGRERLDNLGYSDPQTRPAQAQPGPDVFLATTLYDDGGHTALIGDFVTALTNTVDDTRTPHLLLTNISGTHDTGLADRIRLRTGVLPEKVHVLPGPSLEERFNQLVATLLDLRPRRLFLFHHPDDPLASTVAQPAVARQCFFVHHADATPTLGLHLPGVRVIELNPFAAAVARIRRLPADLLLLTAPDPGPRPHGFLDRGRLVTATCGNAHKYSREYVYSYPDAVAAILQTTGGWHIHIGPLPPEALARIQAALHRVGVDIERFVHRPWVPSLAEALWEYRCDVYLASFPIDGARAYVEVVASATPYLAHGDRHSRAISSLAIGPKSAAVWATLDELAEILQRMSDRGALEDSARVMRRSYDEFHHPDVFRRTLNSIVGGEGGVVDPDERLRDQVAVRSLLRALENVLVERGRAVDQRLDEIAATYEELKRRVDRIVARPQARPRVWKRLTSALRRNPNREK